MCACTESDDIVAFITQNSRSNQVSVCVFLYNVLSGVPCELGHDNPTTIDTLNPSVNVNAKLSSYEVDRELYVLAQRPWNCKVEDLGITICVMFFAEFYAKGQYPLYVNALRCVKELEIIERYLIGYNVNQIKLPHNLATNRIYGLKRQYDVLKHGKSLLSVEAFDVITTFIRSPAATPQKFIYIIADFPIKVTESFYMFTSITRDCATVRSCHEIKLNTLVSYVPEKPVKTSNFDCQYWFELPAKAIWFGYMNGATWYSSYVSLDVNDMVMNVFKFLPCLVSGFISENKIFPTDMKDPVLFGEWHDIVAKFRELNLNCVYNRPPLTINSKRVYFVKAGHRELFKYEPIPAAAIMPYERTVTPQHHQLSNTATAAAATASFSVAEGGTIVRTTDQPTTRIIVKKRRQKNIDSKNI